MRDQKRTYSCALIAGVTSIEMNCKKLKSEAAGTIKYFLDVQDVFKNLHQVYYDEKKSKDKHGRGGSSMDDESKYATHLGFEITARCRNISSRT